MIRISNHIAPHGVVGTLRHYIGDIVYGANDGLITTFAVVAGVEGGALPVAAVIVVGVANLVADGLSMGVGNYLAIRAQESARAADSRPEEESEPARHAAATFLAFVTAGTVPLVPYVLGAPPTMRASISIALTLMTLFGVGAARGRITRQRGWLTGAEMLALGTMVGAAAYGAGRMAAWALAGT